jgi:integrase
VGDLCEFLFWTGWRRAEAQGLRWANADAHNQVVRIERATTKGKKAWTIPCRKLPALVELVQRRRDVTDAGQRKRRAVVPHVFHRNGKPIGGFEKSQKTACIRAGLGREVREPDELDARGNVIKRGRLIEREAFRIPHDFRRMAARNLRRAGVSEHEAMLICGWETRSVFFRYDILNEADLDASFGKLAQRPPTSEKSRPRKLRFVYVFRQRP